ncbi:MAG: hypothetical protein BWZ00_01479 [Bacteroidetes bacterium ADurb.BinA174]|nr:MAG: hypothetical protein BWZ00_01479 [Bacteroidetes bacterium ADurb.BinA174]
MNKTNKILWFAIVLLVILNLATIGTILYNNQQSKIDKLAIVLDENCQNPLTGHFFRQELGFDDAQMAGFREANQEFQYVANNLIFEMDSLKGQMFEELNKAQPDSLKLSNLSNHLGKHHTELKNITNNYYLKIKSVCNASQCDKLKEAFLPLFRDGTTTNIGRRYNRNDSTGHGQGNRYRYGRGWKSQ